MRPTRRFWGTLLLGGFLLLLGAALDRPVLLVGVVGLWSWVVIGAVQFTSDLSATLDAITVSQSSVDRRVAVGDPLNVTLRVDRGANSGPLPLRLEFRPPVTASDTDAESALSVSPTERTAERTVSVTPTVAGSLEFGAPLLTTVDSKGLFTESLSVGDGVTVTADPRVPRNLHVGQSGTRTTVAYGDHPAEQRGSGLEPLEIRRYVPGDDLSQIDWKATARLSETHVREFDSERSYQTLLFFDQRASLDEGPQGQRKLDYLREVALAFVQSAASASDPIGLWGVGDGGITASHPVASTPAHYDDVQQFLDAADVVTEPLDGDGAVDRAGARADAPRAGAFAPSRTPAEARRFAARLEREGSAFDATLRPYVSANRPYVSRIEDRPLFAAVRTTKREMTDGTWTVLFTDDANRAELYEAVQVAARNGTGVVVFLAPAVLFEAGGLADLEAAHRRYREFESFRRTLAGLDGVSAYEVGPGHRIDAILTKRSDATARRRREA